MNVRDLIATLEEQIDANLICDDTEVRLAYQPNYPLWEGIGNVHPGDSDAHSTIIPEECDTCGCDPAEEGFRHYQGCTLEDQPQLGEDREPASHVYLTAGGWESGYASRKLWDEVGDWT